jgi:dCTP deaminase
MSVLAKTEILKAIDKGEIAIVPFDDRSIGPASIDLHLSNAFRVFKTPTKSIPITEVSDFLKYTGGLWVAEKDNLYLTPGEMALGLTRERIKLSRNICGRIEGRGRFAPLGLLVHISCGFVQPETDSHYMLQLCNFGPSPVRVIPGVAVCQIIFERTMGWGKYRGPFQRFTPESFSKDS